jgi:hypothetical protein
MKIRIPKLTCPLCLTREQPVLSWLRARKLTPGPGTDLDGTPRYTAYLLLDCERSVCDYSEIHLPEDLLGFGEPATGGKP